MSPWRPAVLALLLVLLSSCAGGQRFPGTQQPVIGPYDTFHARLLVMEPNHRWQVMLRWSGDSHQGEARLNHAASGRVLRVRWQDQFIAIQDNQLRPPGWRGITAEDLAKHGLVIPPAQLAAIFHNRIPRDLHYIGKGRWQGTGRWQGVRMIWLPDRQQLTISDITHGREARFIILKKPSGH